MTPATSINEVIAQLDDIIATAAQEHSRIAYFACLYRKMTIAVKEGISNNVFEDGPRMERLDVIFANRYIDAWQCYRQQLPLTGSWTNAFNAAAEQYTVLQHLLLGMNAHINLDLGIAAAQVSRNTDIHLLQNDFNRINDVIGSLVNSVQTDLEDICWPMRFVRYIDNKSKDAVINFSMKMARNTAWAHALTLSAAPPALWPGYHHTLDQKIAAISNNILNPRLSQSLLLQVIRWFEPADVNSVTACLKD